jgi:hypothetical protein
VLFGGGPLPLAKRVIARIVSASTAIVRWPSEAVFVRRSNS